tara:strand:+ start:4365 stop:4589 length:225 start_codon:yes stop_codon:yes gene_type:complete
MNDNDNQNSMDPAVFEAFLREIHNRIQEFDVDKEQTTDFFNDAIEQVNEQYGGGRGLELFKHFQANQSEEIDED